MKIRLGCVAVALLLFLVAAPATYADDFGMPPGAVAAPDEAPPAGAPAETPTDVPPPPAETPPPPPADLEILTLPNTVKETPMFPTGQPGRGPCPGPFPREQYPPPSTRMVTRQVERAQTIRRQPVDPSCYPCAPANNCFIGYGGVNFNMFPGLGFGVEFGNFFDGPGCATWSWEVNLNYQDLTDGFNGIDTGETGKWVTARLGIKTSFFPQKQSHPTLRAGLGWGVEAGDTRNTFDFGTIERPGGKGTNYFGLYAGIGWEWDLQWGCLCFTTGPEFQVFAGFSDRGGSYYAVTPTILWHFIWNF